MEVRNKATSIDFFSIKTPQMRAFHMSWFAFFLCFFAWFGIAPLMAYVREEFALTDAEVKNTVIASVAGTIFARLLIGWLCDRIGPRITYTALLLIASIPVMAIGLAQSYTSFLLFRLAIGMIGASFVITQYHTSVMFAPNCVGTANATSAGWGNLGGGVTNMVMPLIFSAFIYLNFTEAMSWRLSMVVAGIVCFVTGIGYFFFTRDLPDGNFKELRAKGELEHGEKVKGAFWLAASDYRVWALFIIYAACFGIELTINNFAALYYRDTFKVSVTQAGLIAGLFGLMNIFARSMGGYFSDRFVKSGGLRGRVLWLFIALLLEGIALMVFSRMTVLAFAIPAMIVFSLFVQMSEGATYSIVPFINKKAVGSVAGIVGAGGNAGAVFAALLFTSREQYSKAFFILGILVAVCAFIAFIVRFTPAQEKEAKEAHDRAMEARREAKKDSVPLYELIPGMKHIRPMDVLRIYLGIALVIKGIHFITNMPELQANMAAIGTGTVEFSIGQTMIAWSVVFAHVIAGACLALGFVTRLAAAANAIIILGAIFAIAVFNSDQSESLSLLGANTEFQFTMLIFVSLVLLVWRGSGPFSVDHLLRIDEEEEPEILL